MDRRFALGIAVAAVLHFVRVADVHAGDGTGEPQIPALIAQLGSSRFAEREAAVRELDARGEAALPALRQAQCNADPEVRRRAAALARRIDKRVQVKRLLASQRVRLSFEDAPLREALTAFTQKTGYPIRVEADAAALVGRRVTLETGAVPFWEALDRFVAAAGLAEREPAPPAPRPNAGAFDNGSVVIVNGNMRPMPADILRADTPDRPAPLVLVDGPPHPLPAHLCGALRIRALAPDAHAPTPPRDEGEAVLVLDVSVEPRLRWQKGLDVRIERVTDDQDQALAGRFVPSFREAQRDRAAMVVNGLPVYPATEQSEAEARLLPLRIQLGKMPAKTLAELSGTLTGLVRSAAAPLVTVDNVLHAAGQTVLGTGGGSVKVVEILRQEGGEWKLRIQIEAPPHGIDDGLTVPGSLALIVNGKRVGGDEEPLSAENFALLDAKGRPFEAVKAITTGRRAGSARELELTYQQADRQGIPDRFVYSGRRSVVVDVSFTLKNVPLPKDNKTP
jgi:hypothetical protein